jgi:hypothetical protein
MFGFVRCTFYVDGDILDPWDEHWSVEPSVDGAILTRQGTRWAITRVVFHEWPGVTEREASVWLRLASNGRSEII